MSYYMCIGIVAHTISNGFWSRKTFANHSAFSDILSSISKFFLDDPCSLTDILFSFPFRCTICFTGKYVGNMRSCWQVYFLVESGYNCTIKLCFSRIQFQIITSYRFISWIGSKYFKNTAYLHKQIVKKTFK